MDGDLAKYMILCSILLFTFLPKVTPCGSGDPNLWDDNQAECKKTSGHEKIIGGADVNDIKTWPWVLALKSNGQAICGASLISAAWAVTAAHCVHDEKVGSLRVRFSDNSVSLGWWEWLFGSSKEYKVYQFIMHPGYDDDDTTQGNDIALLQLSREVSFSDDVRPICLHNAEEDAEFDHNSNCWVVGWGAIDVNGETPSNVLKELKVDLMQHDDCEEELNEFPDLEDLILDRRLCAKTQHHEHGFCSGDSGGPLSCKRGDYWYLAGLVELTGDESHNVDCAVTPDIYTRESSFLEWIKETVDDNGGPNNAVAHDELRKRSV